MRCEILTSAMDRSLLKEELAFLSKYFHNLNHFRCDILIGGAWGLEIYKSETWGYEISSVVDLPGQVEHLEESGCGQLGSDDLYIRLPELDLEFRFCNDSDIHLDYAQPN